MSAAKPAKRGAKKAAGGAKRATPQADAWHEWIARPGAESELMHLIATGTSLNRFITERGFAYNTVRDWIDKSPERSAKYARAREDRADHFADEIVAIGDEATVEDVLDANGEVVGVRFDATAVARNRLRVDARKWIAARMKPRVYGERTTVAGDPEAPLAVRSAVTLTNEQLMVIAASGLPQKGGDG